MVSIFWTESPGANGSSCISSNLGGPAGHALQMPKEIRCTSDLHVQSCAKYSAVLGLMILLGRRKKRVREKHGKTTKPQTSPNFPHFGRHFVTFAAPFFWLPREDVVIREWQPPGTERFRVGTSNSWMLYWRKWPPQKWRITEAL